MNTIDVRQAIIDIFTDKTPHEIQRFSGLPLSRCIEIYTMFKVECMLPREVKAFLNKNTEGE